jgi:hypothetical protein
MSEASTKAGRQVLIRPLCNLETEYGISQSLNLNRRASRHGSGGPEFFWLTLRPEYAGSLPNTE